MGFFFKGLGEPCPPKIHLLIKYYMFKMIGIIMYMYYATTFFFLSSVQVLFSNFFGSGSEREGLWIWVLGLGSSGFNSGVN